MKICWKKLSPKNRKFRSSRGSETRRKLDSVKCFVGLDSNFFGVFLDSIFFMLVTLDSNLIHETLLKITFLGGVLDCNFFWRICF